MSDFIREVDEDYRRDRLMAFLSRYQLLIAGVVVAVILGAGGYRFWADRQIAAAEAVNARFLAAGDLAKGSKPQEAVAAYEAIAQDATKDGSAGYAMLARMRGAEVLATSDPDAAAKAFDAIAEDQSVAASMRDTARMRGALLRVDRDTPAAFEQRYGRFAAPGFTFANSIRELLALAALKRGDFAAAGRYIDAILIDPDAPAALRGRAQALRTVVNAGPATDTPTQPPPIAVKVIGGTPPAPAPAANPAAPTITPPAPSPAAPPAATAAPTPPVAQPGAAKPEPVPPSIKPPGNAPPD